MAELNYTTTTTSNFSDWYSNFTTTGLTTDYLFMDDFVSPEPTTTTTTATKGSVTINVPVQVKYTITTHPNNIVSIEEIVPEKVYKFLFADGQTVKTICSDNDIFDLRYACFLALAKKLYSEILTFEGVLAQVQDLMYIKEENKMVDRAIKNFYKNQKEKAEKEELEAIRKRKHDKLVARKIAKKERKRQEQVNIIAEAIRLSKEEN